MTVSDALRRRVMAAAGYRCEYCQTSAQLTGMPLVIEHIVPRGRGGLDERENLAASCYRCNEFKGVKMEVVDPQTGQLASLFHPRLQVWSEHFAWVNGGLHIAGRTGTGRATVVALRLNNEQIVEARSRWIEVGWHPPI